MAGLAFVEYLLDFGAERAVADDDQAQPFAGLGVFFEQANEGAGQVRLVLDGLQAPNGAE